MENNLIRIELNHLYGVCPQKIERLNRGSAEIYLVELENQKLIFKIFQESMTKDRVIKELRVNNHLKGKGFIVPEYISLSRGSGFFGFTSNNRIAVLQKYIPGDVLDDNMATHRQMNSMAKLYAEILWALKDYAYELPCFSLEQFSRFGILKSIKEAELLELIVNEVDIKQKIKNKIKWMYELLQIDMDFLKYISFENSHGDFNPFQIIFNVNGLDTDIAILDFVSAKKMPIIFELVRCFLYASPYSVNGVINLEEFVSFVKMFRKIFPLNSYDLRYMLYPYYIKSVTNLFGYSEYIQTGNRAFVFLGEQIYNQCSFLRQNIDSYSDCFLKKMKGGL